MRPARPSEAKPMPERHRKSRRVSGRPFSSECRLFMAVPFGSCRRAVRATLVDGRSGSPRILPGRGRGSCGTASRFTAPSRAVQALVVAAAAPPAVGGRRRRLPRRPRSRGSTVSRQHPHGSQVRTMARAATRTTPSKIVADEFQDISSIAPVPARVNPQTRTRSPPAAPGRTAPTASAAAASPSPGRRPPP